ncbi:MAG: hypothetical protein HQ567_24600 [Candidatus Nealsonbacteria bacterium]|nr:hypothetical protein [Candidatus Nealsonbacteria bacterium]
MLKQLLIGIAIVAVLCVLLFGAERTMSYVKGGRTVLVDGVDENMPMPVEFARAEAEIESQGESIFAYEDKVADLEVRADGLRGTIADLEEELAEEKRLLKVIKGRLDEKQETYTIGGNLWNFAQVNQDALARVEKCRKIDEQLAFHRSILRDLETGASQGNQNLAEARKQLVDLRHGLEQLKTRETNAAIRAEIAGMANALNAGALGPQSELENVMHNIERRVASKERRAETRLSPTQSGIMIDWHAEVVTEDASAEIDRLLEGGDASTDEMAVVR